MKPIVEILEERIGAVLSEVAGQASPAVVRPSQNLQFGDYQANGVMGLAKKLKMNPRQLAMDVVAKLDLSDICEGPEVAGPGFINLRLRGDWLNERLREALADKDRLGVDTADNPEKVVVDFSGPNIAKQMHVGHLRSTIIGDVISRILAFYYGGPEYVIKQNHVGDWGLQMGMVVARVILAIKEHRTEASVQEYGPNDSLTDVISIKDLDLNLEKLENYYRDITKRIAQGDSFWPNLEEECRETVVRLQQGGRDELEYWKEIKDISLDECHRIYKQLGVGLAKDDVRGESFYRDQLGNVVGDLEKAGYLKESDGAGCVFLDGFKSKEGEPLPLIVRKSDGAYLYATTDLAALRYRVGTLKASRIVYVTDARQKLHFEMVFACARQAGWASDDVRLEHVPFGSVLGEDNKPFKTRSGENVKLKSLLDEAQERARAVVEQKNPELAEEQKDGIARAVGIGAVKYADLSNNLVSDYVFNWDKMLALEGNTAPYMQYAYARVQSIFRKGEIAEAELENSVDKLELSEAEELTLAKSLLRYGEVLEMVARDLRPHLLTSYLFDLTQAFSGFYTNCPVLKADEPVRTSRLLLCLHTARTIRHGLNLLGIETIDQM